MIRETSSPLLSFTVLALVTLSLVPRAIAAAPAPAPTPSTNVPPAAPALTANAPKINGAEVEEAKGQVIGLNFKDASTLTADDYKQIRQLVGLKKLAFAHGPDDASLKILAGMPAIETFTTNGSRFTDAGLATFATFPALQNLTFFHPGRGITGTGFAALAALPHLESFTLGGTTSFSDPGLAAVAQCPHLKGLRFWHVGVTSEGVRALLALKELKSLTLGQQLDMKGKATLNDDAVAVVAQLTSLEMLTLQESRLSLAALSKLKQLTNLKQLTLTDMDMSESDVDALKKELPKVAIHWTLPVDRRRIDALFGPSPNAPAAVPAPPAAK
jgi:hypothetical protein